MYRSTITSVKSSQLTFLKLITNNNNYHYYHFYYYYDRNGPGNFQSKVYLWHCQKAISKLIMERPKDAHSIDPWLRILNEEINSLVNTVLNIKMVLILDGLNVGVCCHCRQIFFFFFFFSTFASSR